MLSSILMHKNPIEIPKHLKSKTIASHFGRPIDELVSDWYMNRKFSSQEISDEIFKVTKIKISPRQIQRRLKDLNLTRPFSEAFNLAIQKGRKDYSHLRKPIKSSFFRKGITPKVRYQILKRDEFKCRACGKTSKDDILIIDHIIPVVKGGTNDPKNLQILCRECNAGKMLLEEKHE